MDKHQLHCYVTRRLTGSAQAKVRVPWCTYTASYVKPYDEISVLQCSSQHHM